MKIFSYWTIYAVIIVLSVRNADGEPDFLRAKSQKEDLLKEITEVGRQSSAGNCLFPDTLMTTPISLSDGQFDPRVTETVDFAATLLSSVASRKYVGNIDLMNSLLCGLVDQHQTISMAIVILENETTFSLDKSRNRIGGKCRINESNEGNRSSTVRHFNQLKTAQHHPTYFKSDGLFTYPYFHCQYRKWFVNYIVSFNYMTTKNDIKAQGYISVGVDISNYNINQCSSNNNTDKQRTIEYFSGTDKCDNESSYCQFIPGSGWTRGGYLCVCKEGFYSKTNKTFNGSYVEVTYENWMTGVTDSYEYLYKCLKCAPGCTKCNNSKPCLAEYNWTLRIALLTISLMCIAFTLIIMIFVYQLRSLKVFKMASPTFLQICLVGCISMYLEMAAIFPVLNMFYCIFTKWTRHLGFCLTFSALLMKTWRVSLTYRVKSAHKIKLTDKQLLQWMTPIILIMVIYLGSWTISDPPVGEDVFSDSKLKFKQCTYNWWDHSIAIGEMLFLLWGSKVCFGVRKAESFFDEAKCIAMAVYSITVVNVIMASFHVFFFRNSGPDLKYFFGFLRTQMSTSTTIGLVFGPKFFRVLKGRGNQLDTHTKSRGITITVPVNGLGSISEGPPDPQEENEELKEEIQKLAAQMEFMKIVQMEMNNRHLKPKTGGYFSEKHSSGQNLCQSPPVMKNYLLKSEMTEPSSPSGEIPPENV